MLPEDTNDSITLKRFCRSELCIIKLILHGSMLNETISSINMKSSNTIISIFLQHKPLALNV